MNNIIKQLKKGAKNMRLSSAEKAEIKSALLQYVHAHPVDDAVFASRGIPSPFYTSKFRNKKTISAMVIGSLLLGSSVSFAAEGSVPGDFLYPVKVGVNENVSRAVAVTPEARAALSVSLVERRLVEFEKLAVNPSASSVNQQAAADNLKRYTHEAEERSETVENDNDGDEGTHIITNLSAVLNTHEQILSGIQSDIAKSHDTSSRNAKATTTVVFATTTVSVHFEESKKAESVQNTIVHIRESIKEIDVKSEEIKRQKEESTSTTTTAIIVNKEVKNSESKQKTENKSSRSVKVDIIATSTPVTIPEKSHSDKNNAVIETHHESTVATTTIKTEAPVVVEVRKETNKTSTSTESRKREDSHNEEDKDHN